MARTDISLERLGVRILFGMSFGLAVFFGAELAFDLTRTHVPWHDLAATPRAGAALASTVSRAFNNLTSMVLTFIALAVPITANMYTPKLIDIFVRDKVNIAAMVFFAGMGAHAVFGQAMMYDQWAPVSIYWALWLSGVVGFTVLIPYYFYVLGFLNPVTIIRRVTELIFREFDMIVAGVRPLPEARRRLDQEILTLGNVILRAIDRTDRDVSLDAIHGLQHTIMRYALVKPQLAPEWFEADAALFTGNSRDAIGYIVKDRIWVEQKCLHQLRLAYSASLAKMPDAISAVSGVNRRIAVHAKKHGDDGVLRLAVRYFNTFLREAVNRKDVHAIYDVYSQYTFLAKELLATGPDTALQIARHFKYYAEFARWQGMPFIYELAAFDLVGIVEAAYDEKAATRAEILKVFLEFESEKASVRLTKSQVLLAAYFAGKGMEAERAAVLQAVLRASAAHIDEARRSMLETEDPVFWEVTDRQKNLDHVAPERRPAVEQIFAAAKAAPPTPPASS
jgi:hypothetical protein